MRRTPLAVLPALALAFVSGCAPGAGPTLTPASTSGPEAVTPATSAPVGADGEDAAAVAAAVLGPSAVTSPTGLRYEDVVVGDGAEARACDTVDVHYTGTLADGTQFDSSRDRGTPLSFSPGARERQVIPGWDEGVTGMKVGGRRRLVIPPALGYGAQANGPIPANAVLVFDIELVAVRPRPDLPAGPPADADYTTSSSGLGIAVLEQGDGATASPGNRVHVHYAGWLEDGTLFDSSLSPDRCEALVFQLGTGSVIRGWDEGVTGMRVGERRLLRIPPDLGYGSEGSGPIPADSTLVFDVRLMAVQ